MLFNSLLTFWIDFVNLDTAAFDAQINLGLQPSNENPVLQSIPAQADRTPVQQNIILVQQDPPPTAQMASSEQNQQTILTSPITFSLNPISSSRPVANPEKSDTRCAPCTKALCAKRHSCEGRIRRDNCGCDHPRLQKGERVRISENEVLRRPTLRNNEV
jgi:hypothetical protein